MSQKMSSSPIVNTSSKLDLFLQEFGTSKNIYRGQEYCLEKLKWWKLFTTHFYSKNRPLTTPKALVLDLGIIIRPIAIVTYDKLYYKNYK